MPDGSLPKLIIMAICLIGSAFFSSSETAFTCVSKSKLKTLAADGNKTAALALKMSENYDKLLSTLLVGNNIVNILLSSVATLWFLDLLRGTTAETYAATISTAVITVVVLIFGEITPKSLAKDHSVGFTLGVTRILRLIQIILTPINLIFIGWKKLLNLIFKPSNESVTEDEVLTLVDEAHEEGVIDEYNKELIENIFEFDDMTAGEISVHRTEITMLCIEDTVEEWNETIANSRYSRYPVYGESMDDIIGILNAREYFRIEEKTRENVMRDAMTPAYFVPQGVKADVLFRNMKEKHEYFAVVLDEYGGLHGIVTLTDLVECIVGEFTETDEEAEAEQLIQESEDGKWEINGTAPITDVEEALAIKIDDEDSDTFGGYVLGLYGSIPDDGSTFELSTEQLHIAIESIKDHKIEKAIVEVILKEEDKKDKENAG